MYILMRAYPVNYVIMDTLAKKFNKIDIMDILNIYNKGVFIYRITNKGLVKIEENEFNSILFLDEEPIFSSSFDKVDDFAGVITLYKESLSSKGTTIPKYDIFVYKLIDGFAEPLTVILDLCIGNDSSNYYLDDAFSSIDENDDIITTLSLRKMELVGHKTDDEYHATWIYKNTISKTNCYEEVIDKKGVLIKNPWEFIEQHKGY